MKPTRFGQTTVEAEVTRTTDAAVLVTIDGDEHWVPRSVCLSGEDIQEGDTDLIVANWWLQKEGLL